MGKATDERRRHSGTQDDGKTATGARQSVGARPPAIEIRGVSKRFGNGDNAVQAVDDVDLVVEQGSIVGLLGPNGAGKTTLIKSALGMIVPDTGEVSVFGRPATGGRRSVYADVDAMLEGARNDYWRLTVRENLRYFATISGVAPDSVADKHDRLLERLDLADRAATPVRELSRGMKQKVSLASVLAGGAKLLFLDEPTLGLDVESSRTLRRELRRLAEDEGLTIVVSSHDMTTIEAVCDRVVIMADGQIVEDGAVDEIAATLDRETIKVTAANIDAATLDAVRKAFPLQSVAERGGRTTIEVGVGGDQLYELFDCLREEGVTPERVHTAERDLEAAFVDLTGDTADTGSAVDSTDRRSNTAVSHGGGST